MTTYSIVLVAFAASGVLLLVGLIVRESVLTSESERVFASLVEHIESHGEEGIARRAIAIAQKSTASVRVRVKVGAEGHEGPISSESGTRGNREQEKLDEFASVVGLLVETLVPKSAADQEFPIRAFARRPWKDRERLSEVMLLLRAAEELRKARI